MNRAQTKKGKILEHTAPLALGGALSRPLNNDNYGVPNKTDTRMIGYPYFITSKRLGFSEWEASHFPLAQQLWGDENVTKWIDSREKLNEQQVHEKLLLEMANQEKYGVQYFPLFLLQNQEFIGCCGLRPYDLSQKSYEIGFHLLPKHWGLGYAQEAALRMIKYAFEVVLTNELFAGHHPNNQASRHLLLKLGFKYIGDEYFAPTGLHHPSYKLTPGPTLP